MKQWLKIRYELYQQMRTRAEAWTGPPSVGLSKYQKRFEKTFRRSWLAADRNQLLETVEQARLVFLGDFHALVQSQKFHLRLIQSLKSVEQLVLAVEFFQARHQRWVDLYLKSEISEDTFLKKIQWDKNWGFPWQNFRPLVEWARVHSVPILALNHQAHDSKDGSLKVRDQKAARILVHFMNKNPTSRVFVVFGEMHLADDHLPQAVVKALRFRSKDWVSVFLNSEKIYFDLLKKNLETQVEVVRLRKNQFCVLNTPPWVKWQNYLLDLEKRGDQAFDEDEVDVSDEVARVLEILAHEFGISVSTNAFSIYSARSETFFEQLEAKTSREELAYFRNLMARGVSFYVPQMQAGYLAEHSTNHVAVLAMAILYFQFSKSESYPFRYPKDFLGLIWHEALNYLGSKIINPKRKTNTLSDLKKTLANSAQYNFEKEALQLALQQKMSESLMGRGRPSLQLRRLSSKKANHREAARILGGMLGEKISYAWERKLLSEAHLKQLMSKRIDKESFAEVYFEILSEIESWPEPFVSKKERL